MIVIESSQGEGCRSGLKDSVVLKNDGNSRPRCLGTVVFSECFEYMNEQQWRADSDAHLVPRGSVYDWQSDSDTSVFEEKGEPETGGGICGGRRATHYNRKGGRKERSAWLTAGNKEYKPLDNQKRRKRVLAPKTQRMPKQKHLASRARPVMAVPALPRKKIYGWRVLGVFRGQIEVPSILRVYRSIFDCGLIDQEDGSSCHACDGIN